MNWRKWNQIIHRDFGYFFFGMTIIYALSGIALNHLNDWNPSYIIENETKNVTLPEGQHKFSKEEVMHILEQFNMEGKYKKHYYPAEKTCKIFFDGGSLTLDTKTGLANLETITRRPVFADVNYLHYNPGILWTAFSDIFSVSLILIALSGLFILKGKKGIKGRGAILTLLGIIIPILFLL